MISNLEACTEPNYIIRLWQNEDIFTYTRNQKVSLIHPFQEVNDQLCFHFLHKNKNITKKKEMGVRMFPQHRGTREAKKKKKKWKNNVEGRCWGDNHPRGLDSSSPTWNLMTESSGRDVSRKSNTFGHRGESLLLG